MRISILCSDAAHPVNQHLIAWIASNKSLSDIELVRKKSELSGGDLLFLVSCSEIIDEKARSAYRKSLVLHASDLPRGRGWSPHIWEILSGAGEITLSLIEASDPVDSGKIWKKDTIRIPDHALWHEINDLLFKSELALMSFAVSMLDDIEPVEQDDNVKPTYYSRRSTEDSRLDPSQSIESQFNRIRVCDPARFPAFFELHGHQYRITLEKIS